MSSDYDRPLDDVINSDRERRILADGGQSRTNSSPPATSSHSQARGRSSRRGSRNPSAQTSRSRQRSRSRSFQTDLETLLNAMGELDDKQTELIELEKSIKQHQLPIESSFAEEENSEPEPIIEEVKPEPIIEEAKPEPVVEQKKETIKPKVKTPKAKRASHNLCKDYEINVFWRGRGDSHIPIEFPIPESVHTTLNPEKPQTEIVLYYDGYVIDSDETVTYKVQRIKKTSYNVNTESKFINIFVTKNKVPETNLWTPDEEADETEVEDTDCESITEDEMCEDDIDVNSMDEDYIDQLARQ
eukprot:TRINITY_DN8753_c0_g1_i3.p1 TRINITY_DN8753_c0_g1~~TRINITY_DN8753_c0_g1_i3.p1  ORF type:complete len:301 (-),score=67.82 TRINITY_DN8753_c0_g1_i3:325-1227(-)